MLAILQLSGCHKWIDIDDLLRNPDKVPKLCRIQQINSFTSWGDTQIAKFHYNHWEDPTWVEFDETATGRPDFLFKYDNRRRLTDYFGGYRSEGVHHGYEFWYHYVYDGNRIVADTLRSFGQIVNGNPLPPAFGAPPTVNTYEYDHKGRVIKMVSKFLPPSTIPVSSEIYTYNAQGNLSSVKFYTNDVLQHERGFNYYDNKINIHRANKIYMFIDRNYSVNNPANAVDYNRYGLPLGFNVTHNPPVKHELMYQLYLNNSVIQYKCK